MTRVESFDAELRELGYPDQPTGVYHEMLFQSARNFAAEADRLEELLREAKTAWQDGYKQGIAAFAWRGDDGVQYVGTCGTTLDEAIRQAKKDYPIP